MVVVAHDELVAILNLQQPDEKCKRMLLFLDVRFVVDSVKMAWVQAMEGLRVHINGMGSCHDTETCRRGTRDTLVCLLTYRIRDAIHTHFHIVYILYNRGIYG